MHMKEKNTAEDLCRPMALTLKAVIMKDDSVLVVKRAADEKMNPGKWDLPGGHIEKGETVEESLRREILEETGLRIEMVDIIAITEFAKDSPLFEQEKRGLRFLATYVSGEVRLNPAEHSDFVWTSFDDAIALFDPQDGFENEKRQTLIKAKNAHEKNIALAYWRKTHGITDAS